MAKNNEQPIKGLLLRGFIRLLSWFSLKNQQRFGAFVGWLMWKIPNSSKDITLKNLELAMPQLNETERLALAKKSLIETGKTFAELGAIWGWDLDKAMKLLDTQEAMPQLKEAYSLGRGVIFLSPHVGCWEIMGLYLSREFPMHIMYRPPNIESLDKFIRKMRADAGGKLWPTDTSGVRGLMKGLRDGEALGILPDQDPGDSGFIAAPFFNTPAKTMVLVAKLAKRAKCPVFFTIAERLPDGKGFKMHVIPAEEALTSADELEAATALNRGVEACVKLVPEQYQWSYKRYKGQEIKYYK